MSTLATVTWDNSCLERVMVASAVFERLVVVVVVLVDCFCFFFFNDTATTEIYTLSLHDALPISKRFQIFVANRAQKIREYTDPTDWYCIPTSQNPADHASRGLQADRINQPDCTWKTGPSFLNEEPLTMPTQPKHLTLQEIQAQTNDVKKIAHVHTTTASHKSILNILDEMSEWNKMVSFVCTMEQFKRFLTKPLTNKLTVKPYIDARIHAQFTIMKLLQEQHFYEEMTQLKSGTTIDKKSSLYTPIYRHSRCTTSWEADSTAAYTSNLMKNTL